MHILRQGTRADRVYVQGTSFGTVPLFLGIRKPWNFMSSERMRVP